jgi:flagellar hook assembly protein FlgD
MSEGQLDFNPPTSGDWVLIIDDASLELPAPGSEEYLSINTTTDFEKTIQVLENYPNPLNNNTRFEYHIPKYSRVKLTIFNLLGQEVRVLTDGYDYAGKKILDWDGTDNNGCSLSSGTYVYVLQIDKQTFYRKLTILK